MKKILTLIICALMIVSITACKKSQTDLPGKENIKTDDEIKTIELVKGLGGTRKFNEDTYSVIISESHPVVCIYYGDENKYPKLSKALEDNNKSEKEYLLKFLDENKDYATERFLEDGEYFNPFESSITPYVRRADTLVTSILYFGYEYMGGAHGNYYYFGKNYDTKTGKELTLSDVIVDKEKLAEAVSELLDKHWSGADLNESVDIAKLIKDEKTISWTLDYNGITIYFMPYSIASYAAGAQIVTVSNVEYPDILKAEYKKAPSSYGIELAKNAPFYYDITGDGNVDEIIFSAYESDDEGNPGKISIYVNGTTYDEELWSYGTEATFIHTKDNKNYIYAEVLRENDYRQTLCYDLSYGVKKLGEVDGGLKRIFHEGEDNIITQDVLTSPESFYLGKTTQILSTVKGFKKYAISENGLPQSSDKWFKFDEKETFTFTLLADMQVDVYDEKEDKITATKTLKTGDKVVYISTDGEKYGLLKCQDGTVCRVEYRFDTEKYKMTVNGMTIEEVFEGIMYAG